jgi:hypothetical protein
MIESGVPLSARKEFFQGVHDFNNDTFKIALYGNSADLTLIGTTAYTPAGEVVAPGYAAGGVLLTGGVIGDDNKVATIDFNNVVIPGVGMTVRAAIIYNSSKSNRAVRIIDLGISEAPVTNPVLVMPTPNAETAIIRS